MRLQGLLFLVVFVVLYEHQCSARSTTTESPDDSDEWNWKDNYLDDNEGGYIPRRRPQYRDRDEYSSGGRSSSNKGDKYSPDEKPSYKNDDDDDSSDTTTSAYTRSYKRSTTMKPSYGNDDDSDDDDDDDDDKDSKPTKYGSSKQNKKPDELAHMNIYFREPSKDGKRRKPKRFRFPVARYERERFPRSFGPLLNFLPYLPIFADRLTKQTIIYSPTGGVYILPPVISFYGKMTSVAELIASGYASLVSSGAPPPPAVNVAPLVQPGAVVGPGVPAINPATGGFKGGVRTSYSGFPRPDYAKTFEERPSQQNEYPRPRGGY